jgi:predicted NBD/HSP70 family sugar kinase
MQRVAHHVANIVTLLNPRAVVLGGPLTRQEAIPRLIEKHVAQLIVSPVEVVIGNFAPLDGAGFEAHRLARLSFGF